MMKTFTPIHPNSRGARHHHRSFSAMFLFIFLLSFLLLLPGSARAEGEDTGTGTEETSSTIFKYTEVEGGISITGFKDGCSAEDLEIPSEIDGKPVVAIGNEAFVSQLTIKSIKIPSSVTTIGDYAFCYTGITSIEIPSSVTTIGDQAFSVCESLASVTFAANSQLTSIGEAAFGVTRITSIEIPSSVTTIGGYAFNGCESLTTVTFAIGGLLTSIGNSAFFESGITSIEIPSSVTTIGDDVFNKCKSLTSVTFAAGCQLTSIGEMAFRDTGIKSIVIPSSVATIGNYAFIRCAALTSVTFAANSQLKSIGNDAFTSSGITSIEIPSSLTTIGEAAFYDCKSLASITFADNSQLTSIGTRAFEGDGITSIEIPSSVTTIGGKAFNGCKSLTSVTFATGCQLTSIEDYAFPGIGITSIEIPSTVATIGNQAFYNCKALTSVIFRRIPVGENTIEGYVGDLFGWCDNLNTISVPKGAEEIYKAQLNTDDGVTFQGVYIEDDDHFYRFEVNEAKDGLACAGFAEKGKDIKDNVIPSMACGFPVTAVAEKAFQNHDLDYVNIPASIKTIGALAFAENKNLTDVELDGEDTQIATDAFQGDAAIECFYTVNEAAYDKYLAQTFEGKEKLVVHPAEELALTDNTGFTAASRPTYYDGGLMQYERTLDAQSDAQSEAPSEAPSQYATICLPFALFLDQIDGVFDKVYVPMNTLIHHTKKSTPELEHFILMLQEQEPDAIIPAGQPVLVKLSDGTDLLSLSNYDDELLTAALQPKAEAMTVVDWDGTSGLMKENKQFHISYHGTFQPKEAQEADHLWTFNPNGTFGKQTDGTVHPFRLVLKVENETEGSGSEGTGSESTGSEGTGSEGSETESPATPAKLYVFSIGVTDGTTTGIREIISSDAITTAHPNGSSVHAGIIYDLSGRKVGTAAGSQDVKQLRKGIYVVNGKKIVVK